MLTPTERKIIGLKSQVRRMRKKIQHARLYGLDSLLPPHLRTERGIKLKKKVPTFTQPINRARPGDTPIPETIQTIQYRAFRDWATAPPAPTRQTYTQRIAQQQEQIRMNYNAHWLDNLVPTPATVETTAPRPVAPLPPHFAYQPDEPF